MSYDVVVLGGGTAGITAALTARHEGASVALVERNARLGGECTFTGCVPSKTLVEAARVVYDARRAAAEGILARPPEVDYAQVFARRQRVVAEIARDERDERCTSEGIRVLHAQARFTGAHELAADDELLTAERFVVATGSAPAVPSGLGLEEVPYLTNETIFGLRALPRRLLVLGGGAVGLELAQAFRRFGS